METSEPLLPTPSANEDMHERMKRKQNDGTNRHSLFLTDAINLSTSSQEASRASLFPKQDEDEVRQMIAISGRKCYELYENFIQDGSSVKMLGASLLGAKVWYSNKSMLTWNVKVTKSKRLLFQLLPSMRRIEEIEYGLSLIPKTPSASDAQGGIREIQKGIKGKYKLRDIIPHVTRMLPTPTVGGQNDTNQRALKKGQLTAAVYHGTRIGLKLQPAFVEWMMGYPEEWTEIPDSKLLEMRLSRRSRQK